MVGKWAVVLPLLVTLKNVISQPITEQDNLRQARQLNLGECCPCPDAERGHGGFRAQDDFSRSAGPRSMDCPCQDRAADPDTAASMLLPALRAIQPFMKQAEEKPDPKPLLQPEVGLASSVLETLREATDEEYQDALARDAARSAVKLIESDLSTIGDTLTETPKNIVKIFLNPKEDDMDDNLPEPSHIQETRCIHSPLESIHNIGQLRMNRPTSRIEVFETPRTTIKHKTKPSIEVFDTPRRPLKQSNTQLLDVIETPRRPAKKINHKGLLHRNRNDMDSSVGASNVQERVLQPGTDVLKENSLNQNSGLLDLFSKHNMRNSDDIQDTTSLTARPGKIKKSEPKINLKLKDLIDNLHNKSNTEKLKMPVIDLKKYFDSTTRLPPLKFKPLENPLFRANRPLQLKDLLKLKDVDVFSPNDVANFAATSEKPILHSQKLKSPDSNCRDDIINQITSESNRKELVDESSEQIDSIISPTSLNPVYNQGNIKLLDNNEDESDHSPDENINNNSKSTSSIPEDNEAATISEIESEELSIEHPQELPQNNLSKKESIRECLATNNEIDTPKIPSNDETNNDEYKIELVEDLNLPIEFDDSSFSSKIQSTDITNEQISGENADALQDPIAETSNNDFTVMEESNEKTATPQLPFENEDADCNIQNIERAIPSSIEDKNSENTFEEDEFEEDTIHKDLKDAENTMNSESVIKPEKEIVNTVKDEESNDNFSDASSVSINYDTNTFSDPKDNSREVTYKDLQEMSNSILNLSECDSPSVEEENTNMENNKNRNAVEKQNESFETPDTELTSSMMSGEVSKDINAEDDNITETGQVPDEINENGDDNENSLETRNSDVKGPESAIDNEMEVEASERDVSCVPLSRSEPTDSEIPIQLSVDDDHNISKVGTKQATDINTILQVDKHKKFINGLKSKLENLFTTTERAFKEDALANTEDNVNESSNNSPTLAYLNNPKSLNKLGRKSPTPLRDTLPLETRNSAVEKPKSAIDNEMEVEASERDVSCVPLSRSEPTDSEIPNQLSVDDDHNIPKVGTKQTTNINTHLQVDKHTKFINGLKSKLENLFTTTERAFKEDALANTEDNVNESSNNSPTLAYLNNPKSLNKLGHKSPTPLRDTLPLETRNSAVEKPKSAIDNEMEVEASERDVSCVPLSRSEPTDSEIPIQLSVDDDHNIPKVGTKQATDINTISQVDKHKKIINGLKSKLENLFTTTERALKEDALSNTEDNVNESSNNSPTLAYLNDPKSLNKLGRKSATPLRDTLRSEIPGLTLNDFKNKLQIPKNLDKTINLDPELNSRIAQLSSPISGKNTKNQRQKEIKLKKSQTLSTIDNFRPRNTQNNIESPFDLNPPFEDIIFGPGSTLNNLSDRLRSHTDNTIQNIKETFESRLKDSQSTGLRIPTNMINNEDILDTISSRRNELNEKLQAIHADINDRFSTFQQDVLDQLNAPSVRNSEFDPDSSNKRLKLPKTPLQLPLQDTFNFKSITNKQNSKSVIPHLTTFSEENDDTFKLNKFLNLPKKVDGMPRLGNSKIPNLKEVIKKQPRILLDRNNYRTAIEALPSKPQYNLKSSLRKPSINTSTPLIPRPKYFKTKIDIGPRQDIDSDLKATKTKPVLTKSTHVNLHKEPENSPSTLLPARINRLDNNRSDKERNVLSEDSSTDSPLEKLRKSLLRRNQEIKSKNTHKTKPISLPSPSINSDEVADVKEHNVLSRLREGGIRIGSHKTENVLSRSEDDHTSHSHLDTTHSAAQNVERVMVEPLQENVPYKCKLICYKDV